MSFEGGSKYEIADPQTQVARRRVTVGIRVAFLGIRFFVFSVCSGTVSACGARASGPGRRRHVSSEAVTADVMAANPVIAPNISPSSSEQLRTNKLKTFTRTSALLLRP